jgi:hypothetical protein
MIEVEKIKTSWGAMYYIKNTTIYHREDGPAIEYNIGNLHRWYFKGTYIDCHSQKEFERIINLLAFA